MYIGRKKVPKKFSTESFENRKVASVEETEESYSLMLQRREGESLGSTLTVKLHHATLVFWTPCISYLSVSSFSRCTFWHISEMLQRPCLHSKLSHLLLKAKKTSVWEELGPQMCAKHSHKYHKKTKLFLQSASVIGKETHFGVEVGSCQCLVQVLQGAQSVGYLH